MFNYDQAEVQAVIEQMRVQLTKSQDNTNDLMTAVKIVQDGAWVGQGARSFLSDAARLKTEIDAMHNALTTFISSLGQASTLEDSTIANLQQLIAALP